MGHAPLVTTSFSFARVSDPPLHPSFAWKERAHGNEVATDGHGVWGIRGGGISRGGASWEPRVGWCSARVCERHVQARCVGK